MATLTGTVKAASVVYDASTGTNHLQMVIDVDASGNTIHLNSASAAVAQGEPGTPNNLVGRTITVTTDGNNEVTASTGLAIT